MADPTPGAMVGWVDVDALAASWIDGPEDEELIEIVQVAYEKARSWAEFPDQVEGVPFGYRFGQKLLARHLWARKRAGDGEGFGPDGYMIQTYPLVREAYDAIRPRRGPLKGLL